MLTIKKGKIAEEAKGFAVIIQKGHFDWEIRQICPIRDRFCSPDSCPKWIWLAEVWDLLSDEEKANIASHHPIESKALGFCSL